jgi:hypothetical protein
VSWKRSFSGRGAVAKKLRSFSGRQRLGNLRLRPPVKEARRDAAIRFTVRRANAWIDMWTYRQPVTAAA